MAGEDFRLCSRHAELLLPPGFMAALVFCRPGIVWRLSSPFFSAWNPWDDVLTSYDTPDPGDAAAIRTVDSPAKHPIVI